MIKSALRISRALLDWVFGFDFFISYAHSEGGRYPAALNERLQHGFSVFLDKTIYVAGDDLTSATSRRVRMSQQLVLVLQRRTHLSLWVRREVEEFATTGRPLTVININGAWEALPDNWPLRATLEHRLRISENIADDDGEPSDAAVGELIRSFKTVRRETLRSRVLAVTAAAFLAIALIALWQRSTAIARLYDAQAMTIRLLTSAGEFERARSIAFASSSKDARFALARIVLPQLSPFRATVSTSSFEGGVLSLAFQRRSGILMALDRSSVIQIDPVTGNLLRRRKYDKGQHPGSTISALGEPGKFLVTDGQEALICNVSTRGIACTTSAHPVGLRDLQWLTETNYGVAECAGQTATIFLVDDALVCGSALREMPMAVARARSASAIGLFEKGPSSKLVGVVSAGPSAPVARWLPVPVPSSLNEPLAILGDGRIASYKDGRLRITNAAGSFVALTRPIALLAGFLGFVESNNSTLMLIQQFDRKMDTGARLHTLSLASGSEIVEPTPMFESVWGYARDPATGRHWFGGQDGRIVTLTEGTVRTVMVADGFSAPMIPTSQGILVQTSRYTDRNAFLVATKGQTFQEHAEYNPFTKDDNALHYQDYPFAGAVSPSGRYLALGGDALRVLDVTGLKQPDIESLRQVAQAALTDRKRLVRLYPNSQPRLLRWISEQAFISDDFNKELLLWSLDRPEPSVIDLAGDALTTLSVRGPILASTYSGNIWTIDSKGNPSRLAALENLVHLFPLGGSVNYAAHMRNPDRTAFLVKHDSQLVEVLSINGAGVLQDAMLTDGKVALLYDREVRILDWVSRADTRNCP